MSKPVINQFNKISDLFIQRYERYLPTAFDESMTILEKMNKIIEYLNSVGKLVNDGFTQWNEILEWVMTDGLNESVVNKLNEMIEDGTLENIINVELLGSRARIVVDDVSPFNPDINTFWFEDLGSTESLFGASVVVDEERVIYDE